MSDNGALRRWVETRGSSIDIWELRRIDREQNGGVIVHLGGEIEVIPLRHREAFKF
jgi:hypothetical protein